MTTTILPTHYDASGIPITYNVGTPFYSLSTFSETLGAAGCAGVPHYLLSLDKIIWYYNSGGTWMVSDGSYAQSNTAAEIQSNATTFGAQVGRGNIYVRALVKSNSTSQCELEQINFGGTN